MGVPGFRLHGDILLSEARERIDAALFAGVPNAGQYNNPEKLQLLMKILKVPATNYEEAAQYLVTKKEFHGMGDQMALRELRYLFSDGDRAGGRRRTPHGKTYGFRRQIYVSERVADGMVAFAKRKMEELKIESLSFPEYPVAEELPPPKTMRTYLERNGASNMAAFMDELELDAPPVREDRLLYAMYVALLEAGVLTRHGRGSFSKSGHDALVAKMQAAHTDITDANEIERMVERVEAGINAAKFSRQEATASLDPALLAIGEDEIRMLAGILREKAPKLVAATKRMISIGEDQWEAYEQAKTRNEAGVIYLRKISREPSTELLRTQIPFSDENISALFQAYNEELMALHGSGETQIGERLAHAKFKAATSAVESQIISK